MLSTLAFRHLLVRRGRALLLLLGYGIGAGVMLVLLAVGEAMLIQSRDVALVGGGEVTVLPEGIDLEGIRTGSQAGLFFGIDRARFVTRQLLGGPRHRAMVAAVSPVIEEKLVYLTRGDRTVTLRAGGEIPSRAAAVGAELRIVSGAWEDVPADLAYVLPSAGQLYDELDHFHVPTVSDSSWGEWHYFNVVTGANEWWYVSFIVGGLVGRGGRWGGELLATQHRGDGSVRRFRGTVPGELIELDTLTADLVLGPSRVRQQEGQYRVSGEAPGLAFDFTLSPAPHQYFPAIELEPGQAVSGYTVPALRARASGRFCVDGGCRSFEDGAAYHDHNWGVWRGTSWEWGMGNGASISLLYGGILRQRGDTAAPTAPFFLTVFDSLGPLQVYRFETVERLGLRPARGVSGVAAPAELALVARRERDTVRLRIRVLDAQGSRSDAGGFGRVFLQLRGAFELTGTARGKRIDDRGMGFFETYVQRER